VNEQQCGIGSLAAGRVMAEWCSCCGLYSYRTVRDRLVRGVVKEIPPAPGKDVQAIATYHRRNLCTKAPAQLAASRGDPTHLDRRRANPSVFTAYDALEPVSARTGLEEIGAHVPAWISAFSYIAECDECSYRLDNAVRGCPRHDLTGLSKSGQDNTMPELRVVIEGKLIGWLKMTGKSASTSVDVERACSERYVIQEAFDWGPNSCIGSNTARCARFCRSMSRKRTTGQ